MKTVQHKISLKRRNGRQSDSRKILRTLPTTNPDQLFVVSTDIDEIYQGGFISRQELLKARDLFGDGPIGTGFFTEIEGIDESSPTVLFETEGDWVGRVFPEASSRDMTPEEHENYGRYIEKVFPTEDEQTLVVISRRIIDDCDDEPHYVSKLSYDLARARYGDDAIMRDLTGADPAPVLHPEDRAEIKSNHTWFDVHAGAPDSEERNRADQERMMEMARSYAQP